MKNIFSFHKILLYFKRRKLIGAALILGSLFFASYFLLFNKTPKNQFVRPQLRPMVEALYALGTIKADNVFNLRFGMNSIVKKVFVREGDIVRKNAPLVLTDTNLIFRAPYAGTVTKVYYKTGELVAANQIILTLTDLTKLYVIVSLDQESILQIRKNQTVELSFEMLRDKKAHGKVAAIYPSNNEFLVRIDTDNLPAEVLPEMTCDAAIEIKRAEKRLMIPKKAIQNGKVSVLRDKQEQWIAISTGNAIGDWVEIKEGSITRSDRIRVFGEMSANKKKRKK